MRYTAIDRRIEALAGRQYGAFSRKQIAALGASDRFVARRLAEHHWSRPVPGVFILVGSAPTWKRQCKIAELSIESAAIGGRAAAVLHGFAGYRPGRIELVAPLNAYCKHPRRPSIDMPEPSSPWSKGLPSRQPPRRSSICRSSSVVAARAHHRRRHAAKKVTAAELGERLAFYEGSRRPGLPTIRPLVLERLEDGWTPPESELEAILLRVLGRLPSHRDRPSSAAPVAVAPGRARRRAAAGPPADHRGRRQTLAHQGWRLRPRPVARQRGSRPRLSGPAVHLDPPHQIRAMKYSTWSNAR